MIEIASKAEESDMLARLSSTGLILEGLDLLLRGEAQLVIHSRLDNPTMPLCISLVGQGKLRKLWWKIFCLSSSSGE